MAILDLKARAKILLKKFNKKQCERFCMKHEVLSTSHHPDCQDIREILRLLEM